MTAPKLLFWWSIILNRHIIVPSHPQDQHPSQGRSRFLYTLPYPAARPHCTKITSVMKLIMDSNKPINQEAGSKRKALSSEQDGKIPDKIPRRASDASSQGDGSTEEDRRKLEEKRAYNRKNAARARQRTKEHILELTARAERYASKNEELQSANDKLVAEVKALTEENQRLRQLVGMPRSAAGGVTNVGPVTNAQPNPALNTSAAASASLAGASGGMHQLPGGSMPPGLSGAGAGLIDQTALHGGASGGVFFPQADPGAASSQGMNDASVVARQRGLLLQLLQGGQGDPSRQGLPPGFNY